MLLLFFIALYHVIYQLVQILHGTRNIHFIYTSIHTIGSGNLYDYYIHVSIRLSHENKRNYI
jgi:predicted Co/Zn/Cd cation transporter (cation efflux family)